MINGPGEFDGPRTFSLGRKVAESHFTVAISHFATGQLCRWVEFRHWNKLHIVRCGWGSGPIRMAGPGSLSSGFCVTNCNPKRVSAARHCDTSMLPARRGRIDW